MEVVHGSGDSRILRRVPDKGSILFPFPPYYLPHYPLSSSTASAYLSIPFTFPSFSCLSLPLLAAAKWTVTPSRFFFYVVFHSAVPLMAIVMTHLWLIDSILSASDDRGGNVSFLTQSVNVVNDYTQKAKHAYTKPVHRPTCYICLFVRFRVS